MDGRTLTALQGQRRPDTHPSAKANPSQDDISGDLWRAKQAVECKTECKPDRECSRRGASSAGRSRTSELHTAGSPRRSVDFGDVIPEAVRRTQTTLDYGSRNPR